ncbi:DUF4186 family protein [Myxococcota bacterium]
MMPGNDSASDILKPLAISCTDTDCDHELHCFRKTKKMVKEGRAGTCRACGANLIDWRRVHNREINDAQFTFSSLKNEYIRHHFWHIEIDRKAVNHARRKGVNGMSEAAGKRIAKYLAPAQPYRDGQQTPFHGNVLYYAQHATATCCRKCLEEWHDIPQGRQMTDREQHYCTDLLRLYVAERMPDLMPDGEKVPPIRQRRKGRD